MDDLITKTDHFMREVLDDADRAASELAPGFELPLYGMGRYHLGWADETFRPASFDVGKRIRPQICLLCCVAAGGDPEQAVPAAAAIELLHNFTLIHDDVQDRGATRRHRSTVWALWGTSQAINTGDALFALSQLALFRARERGVPGETVVDVARNFNEVALRIVEGQVLDLEFEQRWNITIGDYLGMISGKTAAIVAFSAWAGARIAGATAEVALVFKEFGRALGLGFQVRDDALGIWGETGVTGKPAADDIRRRKKTLPIIALASAATPTERTELQQIFAAPRVDEAAVARVLELLRLHEVESVTQSVVDRYHDEASRLLKTVLPAGGARAELESLLSRLSTRDH